MFKLRAGAPGSAANAEPPSIEDVRRRARHRLIGATVLVLAGVVGLPLLFDRQPRPLPVDIPIEIPAKTATAPLAVPAPVAEPPSVAAPAASEAPAAAATPGAAPVASAAAPETPPVPAATASPPAVTSPSAAAASTDRFIVQVGAFADADRAREVRQKLERAGLKTYTHVAQTAEGKRIRVRLGPFASKADADKAAAKAKSLGLAAAILTL